MDVNSPEKLVELIKVVDKGNLSEKNKVADQIKNDMKDHFDKFSKSAENIY